MKNKYVGWIYKWTNIKNGKSYIGQTRNKHGYKERWSQHLYNARTKRDILSGKENRFYKALRTYGSDSFKKKIISEYTASTVDKLIDILNEKEIFYINKYNTYKRGYNSTLGGKYNYFNSDIGCEVIQGKNPWISRIERELVESLKIKLTSDNKIIKLINPEISTYKKFNIDINKRYRKEWINLKIDPLYTKSKHVGFSDYVISYRNNRKEFKDLNVISMEEYGVDYISENTISMRLYNNDVINYDVFGDVYGYTLKDIKEILRISDFECGSDLHIMSIDIKNIVKNMKLSNRHLEVLELWKNDYSIQDIAENFNVSRSSMSKTIERIFNKIYKQYELDFKKSIRLNYIKGDWKICKTCGEPKLLSNEFDKNGRKGYVSSCKRCRKI